MSEFNLYDDHESSNGSKVGYDTEYVPGSGSNKISIITIISLVIAIISMFMNLFNGGMYISLGGIICAIIGLIIPGKRNRRIALISLCVNLGVFAYFYHKLSILTSIIK